MLLHSSETYLDPLVLG